MSESKKEPENVKEVESVESSLLYKDNEFDSHYLHQSKILSDAIDEIGFGKYQWGLLVVTGFGWWADNAWETSTLLIIPRLVETNGVHYPPDRAPYLLLCQTLGLLVGAVVWSFSADIIGRKLAFTMTFLCTGIFSLVAGASPNFAAIGTFCALWSVGVGGNLPVDSAIFLEALPSNKKWILTAMSAWWALGQLIANVVGWGLIANYSCPSDATTCLKEDNKGWRYYLFTLGALTLILFLIRFVFPLYESPRFYLGIGDYEKAVSVVHGIAKVNGKTSSLTVEDLKPHGEEASTTHRENVLIKEKLKKFNASHIRECFSSRKMTLSLILVVATWSLVGMAFPLYYTFLPYYLEQRGNASKPLSVRETYRNSLIILVIGIPASLIAGILVEFRIGRKGVLSISLLLTGVFLFCSTTAKTSNAYLGWNCGFSFASNMMYGVLYAYTPEVMPAKVRGTGVGIAAASNRVFGVFSPIIAIYANLKTSAPIFASGALFFVAGVLSLLFPYEPRGKANF
ncbi:uncharacterized protein KQ657_000457 [Scheffersomyces spartinae]|uniref:Major facilitator superfamily (MFS) profile domain-containing protein n=1 Tax=Scheffersomyces spartinae TaxID=45513 RepID=A0A9P7V9A0_9ASCO|nr:uncharacterized protein KQ657_000457 [Scheffersomyces spartinae]KAG7193765.1 hypothetical protein KQ657_000457 [Scheffersomyces spartinae]